MPDNRGPLAASVIVAAHNAAGSMPDLVAALAAQTLPPDQFEVIVVDDASTDGTGAAAGTSGRAHVVRAQRRGGAYVARNIGLDHARGEVVAITDADCRPAADWLEQGLRALGTLGADLVAGRIDVPLPARPSLPEVLEFARFFDQRGRVEEHGIASTSNLFVRTQALKAIGRFNERMVSGGDAEFSLRATAAGLRLRYSDDPVVVHAPRRSARSLARKSFRIGFGVGQLRHVGRGPARDRPQIWSRPRNWRPYAHVARIERVARSGYEPSRAQALMLDAGQYALVQLPMLVGNLVSNVRRGRAPNVWRGTVPPAADGAARRG